ncbi:MAG: tRNA(Met) cytidine acetyltransferase TmcA [Halodesulfurarchaeum sp.]
MLESVASALREEAVRTNERRLLVLRGDRENRFDAATRVLDGAGIDRDSVTLVGRESGLPVEYLDVDRAGELLGTTREAVIVDCHDECRPNAIGRVVGSVTGGGLLVLLTPDFERWVETRDAFDATLAVPPAERDDVSGHFRERLVHTLEAHPGVAIVDLETESVIDDGVTHPAPRATSDRIEIPAEIGFPVDAYEATVTQDQVRAVQAFEHLESGPGALVVSADRGRGKSSAAGIAAACFAARGETVLVTAPSYQNVEALFERATAVLESLDELEETASGPPGGSLEAQSGGNLTYEQPVQATESASSADLVIVDEAAALPVGLLESLLAADRIAFVTTVHGYEGTGRGFDVRFRDRLAEAPHDVVEATLEDPIRYAAGDPVEVWAFRALLLDARPAVEQLIEEAVPAESSYRSFTPSELLEDEHRLREVFGLLVYAHYRTEPDDLARLLDAPNLTVRALCFDGHVVSVALLAREGGLDEETRASVYEGGRIRGNMLPDVLMSQLRDEAAGEPVGIRVVRIATHHAVRSRGLGSRLIDAIESEFGDIVDWIGVGYGATPDLIDFWKRNGFETIHLATTRNESSGEYSILMLHPSSERGATLAQRHGGWFVRRNLDVLPDSLRDMDPDVVRAALDACTTTAPLYCTEEDWRLLAGASFGPALYSVDPAPFRQLVLHHLTAQRVDLEAERERLLIEKLLQVRPWPDVVDDLEFEGTTSAMREMGDSLRPPVEEYGPEVVMEEAKRYRTE